MSQLDRKERVVFAITEFPFWDYSMDDVSSAIEEDPEAQEWIPALADAIINWLDGKEETDGEKADQVDGEQA